MTKQLTQEDIMNAKGVYLYNGDTIYVEFEEEPVYGITRHLVWREKHNFYDYFDSSLMMSYFSTITKEEAIKKIEEWKEEKSDSGK